MKVLFMVALLMFLVGSVGCATEGLGLQTEGLRATLNVDIEAPAKLIIETDTEIDALVLGCKIPYSGKPLPCGAMPVVAAD